MKTLMSVLVGSLLLLAGYVATQQPRFGASDESWQVILLKGGVRSWTLRWCEGHTWDGRPVIYWKDGTHLEYRHYRWPKYEHFDIRWISLRAITTITNTHVYGSIRIDTHPEATTNQVFTNRCGKLSAYGEQKKPQKSLTPEEKDIVEAFSWGVSVAVLAAGAAVVAAVLWAVTRK